jgi:hypothetical protein
MPVTIESGVRLFFDVEGPRNVPDGPRMREKPLRQRSGPGHRAVERDLGVYGSAVLSAP